MNKQILTKSVLRQLIREEMNKEMGKMPVKELDSTNAGTAELGYWAIENYPGIIKIVGNDAKLIGELIIAMTTGGGILGVLMRPLLAAVKQARKEKAGAKTGAMQTENKVDPKLVDIVSKIEF